MRDRLTESPLVGSHALELFDMVRRPTGSVPSLTLMDAENIELMTCTMTMLESMQHVAIAAAVLDRTAPKGGEALVEATAALAAAVETGIGHGPPRRHAAGVARDGCRCRAGSDDRN